MLDYDIAIVDYQAGKCEPLPTWAKLALAAKWYGSSPWELMQQDDWAFWMEAGLLFREIEAEANERARKKT